MITVNEYVRTTGSYVNSGNDYRLFSTNLIVYATPISAIQNNLFTVYLIGGGKFITDSAGITAFGEDLVSVNEYTRRTGKLKNNGLPIKVNVNNVSTVFPSGTGYELNGTTQTAVVRVRLANGKVIITDDAGVDSIEDRVAANVGGGSSDPLEVLTTYPVTTPASAGTRFWYKGNEWHYMTQDEIDSAGWTGLVTVGFPAPVRKVYDEFILLNSEDVRYTTSGASPLSSLFPLYSRDSSIAITGICDIIGFGMPQYFSRLVFSPSLNLTITEFKNATLLTNLKDDGTTPALGVSNLGLTDLVINSFFTQLPITTNTVTLRVDGNPGSATCDPTIATAKGYTVIV